MWILQNKRDKRAMGNFDTRGEADTFLTKLGESAGALYSVTHRSGNARLDQLLTEGLVKGDLYKILLPRISVDEFVPGDPDTDNIVIAFFLKGVPEATLPFKVFAEQSNGVISADYGDSETVVGAQNVYVEFDRENLDMEDIHALMIQAAMLAGLEIDDFTMTFPNTDDKFPYSPVTMKEYFIGRDNRKNEIAQRRAIDRAAKEFEQTLAKAQGQKQKQEKEQQPPEQTQEALINRLAGVALTG